MKAFIFVYGNELGTRAEVKACLDRMPQVISWRYELPNCFFLLSESTARELGDKLVSELRVSLPRFIVSEISHDFFGWLVPETYEFIAKKVIKSKGGFGE